MAETANAERCCVCGRFMDCNDPDAQAEFTPDSDRSIESCEWTCGPCRRARPSPRPAADGSEG